MKKFAISLMIKKKNIHILIKSGLTIAKLAQKYLCLDYGFLDGDTIKLDGTIKPNIFTLNLLKQV